MRIKIIGENNCARATRHLLRLAGFAVTDFLPADAVIQGPHAGYAITIDLSPSPAVGLSPASAVDLSLDRKLDLSPATYTPNTHLGPDCATQQVMSSASGEAFRRDRPDHTDLDRADHTDRDERADHADRDASLPSFAENFAVADAPGERCAKAGGGHAGYIHFDSVDSALEAAVLRHVAQLAAGPVIIDRPGGVVHSE